MSKLANIKVKAMEHALLKAGFTMQVAKSSHRRFKHPDGRHTVLAYHPGNIPKPIVSKMLKQAGISVEEFEKLAK